MWCNLAEVSIKNVRKAYGDKIVFRNLDLTIRDGECFTLLGPSGCGKTVLLRMVAGFEQPDSGTVSIGGEVLSSPADRIAVPPDKRSLGVVFQDYAVWPHMTVRENVLYPLKIQQVGRKEAEERTQDAIDSVNLSGLENRMPYQLSGGQQQRVAIARAVVASPKLILADEPTGNLDSKNGREVMDLLSELHKEGATIVMVTHSQKDAGFAQRIINLFDGKIVNDVTGEL